MKKYIVIVAGGKGLRMGSEIPKQFMELVGRPILMHTMEIFRKVYHDINIVLVLPETQLDYWKTLCVKHNFKLDHKIAFGGETRFHSVKNGLELVEKKSVVGIHDAVRPLVNEITISNCFENSIKKGNAIPVVPINDSIRKVEVNIGGGKNNSVDREHYFIVQTPQVFLSDLILEAFQQDYSKSFTDDASVLEADGKSINLVEGNFENIKITRPFDLKMAEILLSK